MTIDMMYQIPLSLSGGNGVIIAVIAYVVVAVSAFIVFFIMSRNKWHSDGLRAAADKIISEDFLEYSLRNPRKVNTPAPSGVRLMVAVTVQDGKKSSEVVYDPAKTITFGRNEKNNIRIYGEGISGTQGRIYLSDNKVYLENLSSSHSLLVKRKGKKCKVTSGKSLRLRSKDTILMKNSRIDISFFRYDINKKR